MDTLPIVGAGGHLGGLVARRLLAQDRRVRAASRRPEKLAKLQRLGAEVVRADLRDRASLAAACAGVQKVFTAAHSFLGVGRSAPEQVDGRGHRELIEAAREAGVRHFVFTSAIGARTDHPIDLFRLKFSVEEALRASGLSYTILRPAAFMETWAEQIGRPVWRRGWTVVVGQGVTPMNFVAAEDVARVAEWALEHPEARHRTLSIQGPHAWTMNQVALLCGCVARRRARVVHLPLGLVLAGTWLLRPWVPGLSRRLAACLTHVERTPESRDSETGGALGPIPQTTLEEWARRRFQELRGPARPSESAPVIVLPESKWSVRHGSL